MIGRFAGSMLIATSALLFFASACRAFIEHPNFFGALLAACQLLCGTMVCVSVARDWLA